MNIEASFKAFIGWIIAGMGFRIGWGIVVFIIDLIARAVHGGG